MSMLEPASPFVVWKDEDRRPLDELATGADAPRPLLADLLSSPDRVVDRLLDQDQLQPAVLGSLATVVAATAFFACTVMSFYGPMTMVRAASVASFNTMLALAAAFGPIWATSILLAARLPLARLVGVLVTSAATGAMILAAAAPLPYFLWKLDHEWLGPIAVLGAFAVSGAVTGARVHKLMFRLAERIYAASSGELGAELGEDETFRVGILARMSLAIVAFTVALAFWAFDALSVVV